MTVRSTDASQIRRAFVSGLVQDGVPVLARLMEERGVEVSTIYRASPAAAVTQELLGLVREAEFVALVLGERGREAMLYELGFAQALGKPVFLVQLGAPPPLSVGGAMYVAIETAGQMANVAGALDLFLRNAKRPAAIGRDRLPTMQQEDIDWARHARVELRRFDSAADRGRALETLVGRLLRESGATADKKVDGSLDFVTWIDDVAYELGGPVLFECKILRGGTGSAALNARAFAQRLEPLLDRSGAALAVLVYDHDRPTSPPSLDPSPRTIVMTVDDLIDAVARGGLGLELLQRRRRALRTVGPAA